MTLTEFLYSLGLTTIRPLLSIAGRFSPKLAEAVDGRRQAATRMETWAAKHRGPGPLLWLHGASAGELAGAAPVIAALRNDRPQLRVAVTWSSPSGRSAGERLDPVYAGFVPLDLPGHASRAVRALRPAAIVYAKLDVWPNLTAAAVRAGVPVGMVNATVRPGSGRLRSPSRAFTRSTYASLRAVGAVSDADRERLLTLGARPEALRVTGDAAFDQALARLEQRSGTPRLPDRGGRVRLLAGSTWPEDEAALIEAAAKLPWLELVIVPHEPGSETVDRLRTRIRDRMGVEARVYEIGTSAGGAGMVREAPVPGRDGPPPPIVVNAVGLLAELYAEADAAYVGGGLSGRGLHSVVEPAAAAVPAVFGARHDRWEARELAGAGAALAVEGAGLAEAITRLRDPARRRTMGEAARAFVGRQAGAGTRGAELVSELLEERG